MTDHAINADNCPKAEGGCEEKHKNENGHHYHLVSEEA